MSDTYSKIKKYAYGNPLKTGAVVIDVPASCGAPAPFVYDAAEETFTYKMKDREMVFGLGETVRGINKRGWRYTSNNSDDPHHEETKESLYASQNFLIIDDGTKCFGVFVDNPGTVTFDIGYTSANVLTIKAQYNDTDFYVLTGDSPLELVTTFRKLVGKSYMPPLWAFGYGQSRWGYKTAEDIREVARRYKESDIPVDMIYMDIDYMQDFKDFTVNPERFPDFKNFVKEMREQGIHLIPIIDAGVKIEDGYDVYEEGVKNDFFCKKKDGTNLVAAVWPGKVHFPDFLNSKAAKWFGQKYKALTDAGIDGFWNDMNEPAIFYTEDHLKEVFEGIEEFKGKDIDIWEYFKFNDLVSSLSNNPEDYRRFYHNFDGVKVRHDKVHNLYGFYMTKAAGEAFKEITDNDVLLFSRASYTGMHRYGGVWTGDNFAWWSHLLLNIKMMPSLNMTGFLYSGADIGGFNANTTEDLMMRWVEFGIFTPLFRNHSALGTRDQELYRFERKKDFKNLIELRYAFAPYIIRNFRHAAENDTMYIKPLWFEYRGDERTREVEDQLLVGDSIMIAPIYEQNANGRYVYLPEKMKLIRFRSYNDYDEEVLEAGDHYVPAKLNEVLVFIRPGKELKLATPGKNITETDKDNLKTISFA